MRRKPGIDISVKNAIRISMIAAAANADLAGWGNYVGDCLTEFAFEDIERSEAIALRHHITILRQLEPRLWLSTPRADAATAAFIQSAA